MLLRAGGRRARVPVRRARRPRARIALVADADRPRASASAAVGQFDIGGAQWQFTERAPLFAGFRWALGIDGIALMLIVLTVFLMPICILASRTSIDKRVPEYMAAFLFMETLMIGVFAAQDLFLFYIFFEAGLIPMYLIIGVWGGGQRIYAALQVLPLHPARLGADADRDAVDGRTQAARPTSRR